MNITIDELVQPTVSYSRTGRMTGSVGASRKRLDLERKEKTRLDMSKLLSVDEVDEEDRGGDDDVVCSSAREHPSVHKKRDYVLTAEKEIMFAKAMEPMLRKLKGDEEVAEDRKGPSDEQLNATGALSWIGDPPPADEAPKRKENMSPCFLAGDRFTQPKKSSQAPPVGHYHPRFDVVELPVTKDVSFTKAKRAIHRESPKHQHSEPRHVAVDEQSDVTTSHQDSRAGAQSAALRRKGDPAGSPKRAKSEMSNPTWPFLSRDSHMTPYKHPSSAAAHLGPHEANINRNLIEDRKNTSGAYNFAKQVSREKAKAVGEPKLLDLFYNPKPTPFRTPVLPFSKQVPRFQDDRKPRTAHDVETLHSTVDLSKFDKFKYKSQPVLTDIGKHTSRERVTNNVILQRMNDAVCTSELDGPATLAKPFQTRAFKMKTTTGRKAEKPKLAQDVIYDVSYSTQDKHEFDVKITSTPIRPQPGQKFCETQHLDHAKYHTEHDPRSRTRKITHDFNFGKVVSRDQREKVTTVALAGGRSKTEMYDVKHSQLTNELPTKGDPRISSHMSREKRMKLQSPVPDQLDRYYDWSPDSMYPPTMKGSVKFDQQVHRDHHGGSHFSNASKEMLRLGQSDNWVKKKRAGKHSAMSS